MSPGEHPATSVPRLLAINAPATDQSQADTRHQLERWLVANHVAKSDVGDVVLAASEALSNVVRHAYSTRSAPGPMNLVAKLTDSVLSVAVQDEGTWKETVEDPPGAVALGGWGLPLMRSLSQSLTIEHGRKRGTNVTARYDLAPQEKAS
jgi:anti-sigma regulatory factor (Ser/Thr protein kinase)